MEAKMAKKTMGIEYPASRKRKGLVTAHKGLGCGPIPLANRPSGKTHRTAKTKNTAGSKASLRLRESFELIRSARPRMQKSALIQTRGRRSMSKKPGGPPCPWPCAQDEEHDRRRAAITGKATAKTDLAGLAGLKTFLLIPAVNTNVQQYLVRLFYMIWRPFSIDEARQYALANLKWLS
jgi:hypothetical protein